MRAIIGLAAAVLALATAAAHADDKLRDLCPDRPGKGTSACTLDKGHWQLEVDAVDVTRDRSDGLTTDSWIVAAPTLKYGLTDTLDVEASLNPYQLVRTKDRATGVTTSDSGVGDLYLHLKAMVAQGPLTVALDPYVKLPTATHNLGNGKVEAGLIVPMSANLPAGWALGVTAEGDALENSAGDGHHGADSLTVGLSHAAPGGFNLGVELWGGWDFDPAGHSRQTSFDLSAAWIPAADADLQLDGGVNFGLNSSTPQVQLYAGVSRRF
ncbi:MAG: hypothetical protein JWP35_3210 [Caulobacter sp.]|nr:hypothetical protein [Caulobacter sp.]